MKKRGVLFKILSFVLLVLTGASCGSNSQTVVIHSAPTGTNSPDSVEQATTENNSNFQQLTMGLNQPIHSLDPLFAQNESELRAIQLLYEGLVRYDDTGQLTPAAAKKWSISDNHKTYRFTLRNDLYYQDSDLFNNGRGRKVVAADVKRDVERMAHANIPERASRLFMNVRGFEPFYQEQHKVLTKSERQLTGINGIKTPNDSTVVFQLATPDDLFLNKLAAPFAVIYPIKAAAQHPFEAVGTGPFQLSQQRSDSLYIFSRFGNYYNAKEVKLNRVDIKTSSSESNLLGQLRSGDIQLIPELGPLQRRTALNGSGGLSAKFSSNYHIIQRKGVVAYFLRYNTGADLSKQTVKNVLGSVKNQHFFSDLPSGSLDMLWGLDESNGSAKVDSLTTTYAADPYVKRFYAELSSKLAARGVKFVTSASRVANRNIPLYVETYVFMQPVHTATPPDNTLLTIEVKSRGLVRQTVQNLHHNRYPWWINLRGVTVQSTTNP